MKIVALIPAYNEAETILTTLEAVRTIELVQQIVVINDGSTDSTAELVAQEDDVLLINNESNRGKGSALNQGWRTVSAQIYLLLDADLGRTAKLASELLKPILAGQAQMTVARFEGNQSLQGRMGFGLVRRFACWGVKFLTGQRVTSPLSGQRAIQGEVLTTLGPFFPGFGVEIGLTVGALHHGFEVEEVPLAMKHRGYGRGLKGIKHRGRQFIHVWQGLYKCWQKGWR